MRFFVQLAKEYLFNYSYKRNQQESLKNILFQFKRFLRVENALGEVTVEGYLKMTKKFIKDISRIYPSREMILSYLLDLHTKKIIQPHQEFHQDNRMVYAVFGQSS